MYRPILQMLALFFGICLLGALSSPVFCQVSPGGSGVGSGRPQRLSDSALVELTQQQTFRYFWDFGHPVSGLARERSNKPYGYGNEVVTIGGSGFGVMAIIVGAERKWVTRDQAVERLLKMMRFLSKADS